LRRRADVVELLLEYGANVNVQDNDKKTPLHIACCKNDFKIAELLLEHGANVNVQSKKGGNTPLHYACRRGNVETVKLLLEYGADVNVQNKDEVTPLHIVCKRNNIEIVELLLKEDANINVQEEYGDTPLCKACRKGNVEIVELLLKYGVDKEDGKRSWEIAFKNRLKNKVDAEKEKLKKINVLLDKYLKKEEVEGKSVDKDKQERERRIIELYSSCDILDAVLKSCTIL
jgi:ankyrin repeat protein